MAAVTRTESVRQSEFEVRSTRDRELLLEYLEQDRLTAAYAICDLDDREFPRTRWGVALDGMRPIAVALEYTGLSPQPLFVMGDPEGVTAVVRDVIKPRTAWLAAPSSLLPAVDEVYRIDPGPPMVRMWVDRNSFHAFPGVAVRLTVADIGELNRLYDLGLTSWLPSESVARGVYYGVRVGGRLVAAAGTHVITRDQRLAAVGNVLTHRDFRNRGYAKVATSAVTAELLRFCDQVVLNVRSDNPPALAAYQALGYQEHTRFEERLVHRRGTWWDSITLPLRRFMPTHRRSE
jgi:ribosomal protein S18 acetylase RimI-like enzyme